MLSKITPEQEQAFLHEHLHGTWLVINLFDQVCESGNSKFGPYEQNIFDKYPHLKDTADTAIEALAAYYQAVGEVKWSVKDEKA